MKLDKLRLDSVEKIKSEKGVEVFKIGLEKVLIKKNKLEDELNDNPMTEEELKARNIKPWEYNLAINHPVVYVGILMTGLGAIVSSSVYTLVKITEYLKSLYAN